MTPWHILEFEEAVERGLQEITQKHFPLDWKEDVLTHRLAICFRDTFREITLHGTRHPLDLEFEVYKLHGHRETSHGDIGVLIRWKLPAGTVIEGAGFLEAKLRARDSTRFMQVRHQQVSRLLSRSRYTHLLLYDYNPITILDSRGDPYPDEEFLLRRWRPHQRYARVTHGAVLPLPLAAAINQYDDSLYRFCHSLAHQFSRRYFYLHDLDFRDRAVKAVKGFPEDVGSPNIVLVVRAAVQGHELPERVRPNSNLYAPLE